MQEETIAPSAVPQAANSGLFPVTLWSMIQAAKQDEEALAGLDRLGRAYWRPLYVFMRQRGADHDAASDAVQGFFEHLLSMDMLRNVQRGDVRFRSFLLRCFTNWLANERRDANRQKRGGGVLVASMEEISELEEYASGSLSPDVAYDHRWARAMVDQAMIRLEAELAQRERSEFLQELRRKTFATDGQSPDWEEMAFRYAMTHGAVRKASADLRRRFGVMLREEVRNVVSSDDEVDEELRYLVSLLSAG